MSQEIWELQSVFPSSHKVSRLREWLYQQLRGTEDIQGEGLDAGVMHTQLPMDPGALDARQDA